MTDIETVLKAHNEVYNKEFDSKKLQEIEDVRTLLQADGIAPANEDGSLNMQFIKPINTTNAYLKTFAQSIAVAVRVANGDETPSTVDAEEEKPTAE